MVVIARQLGGKALRLERCGILLSKKFYSLLRNAVLDTKQGDKVIINCNVSPISINVTSAWQEHCDIAFNKNITMDITEQSGLKEFTVLLNNKGDESVAPGEAVPQFHITVPEMFNVGIQASDAAITFRNKIMGDVSVVSDSGRVSIDQLRGENISLQCTNASVEVNKKLEGSLSISCRSLAAQMIHGSSVDIFAHENVNVKALYAVNSSIVSSAGSVQVGLSHGHTAINSALSCSLNGIDGSFVVNNTDGGATLQINKLYPGSESIAVSRNGSISTLVDPDVVTNLHCSTRDESCIEVDADGFKSRKVSSTTSEGVFSGHSRAVKRPLSSSSKFKRKSGKINIDSAALLSLRNTTKAEDSSSGDGNVPSSTLPSLSLVAKSGIVVESVSWIGKIMKKYDM